jgi:hypothetical protein
MPLIDFNQIDWGPERDDLNDPTHRHIPDYKLYPQFHNDPPLPYFGNCPDCKQILEENRKFYEELNGVKLEY